MRPTTSPQTQTSVEQIAERVVASGRITRADEAIFLKAATSETPLTLEAMSHVKRVIERLQMGLIKVVD